MSIVAARLFGPSEFGQYSYLVAFAGMFIPLMVLGMERILLREIANAPDYTYDVLYTAFIARTVAGLITALIGLAIFKLIDNSLYAMLCTGILLLSQTSHSFRVFNIWFQHHSLNGRVVFLRSIFLLAGTLAKLYVIVHFTNIISLITVFSIEQAAISIGIVLLYRASRPSGVNPIFSYALLKDLFDQSKYLVLSGFTYIVYLKADIIMISRIIGNHEAGLYSAAARITESFQFIPEVLIIAMYPGLLQLRQADRCSHNEKIQLLLQILFLFGVTVATLGTLFAPLLIPFLFGDLYKDSIIILQFHLWSCCFLFMRSVLSYWIVAEKFAQFSLISHGSGLVANVALNFLLIPEYGAIGAAWATVASMLTSTYLCLLLTRRTRLVFKQMSIAFNIPRAVIDIFRFIQRKQHSC